MPRAKTKSPYTPTPAQRERDERLSAKFAAKRAEKAAAAERAATITQAASVNDAPMAMAVEVEQLAKEVWTDDWPTLEEVEAELTKEQPPAAPAIPAHARERETLKGALFDILVEWPTRMDRLRWQKPGLFGVNFHEQVDKVRTFASATHLFSGVVTAEDTSAAWDIVQEWPAIVRRATYGGASLSLAEYGDLNDAERLLAEWKELERG